MGTPSINSISKASSDRINPKVVVARMAGSMSGMRIRQSVVKVVAPATLEASSRGASRFRKAGVKNITLTPRVLAVIWAQIIPQNE